MTEITSCSRKGLTYFSYISSVKKFFTRSWAPTGMGKGGTCTPLEKLKCYGVK